jgi:hypothetical protein
MKNPPLAPQGLTMTNPKHGLADYDQAIRLDPKSARVRYFRGVAYTRKRQWDRAIADFEEGQRLAGNDRH